MRARLTRLSLRLRILLFFAALALGAIAVTALGLVLGYRQLGDPEARSGFLVAGIVAAFAILLLTAGVWLLFDENIAKPIERLAAQLRARVHAGVAGEVDTEAARYLGDLAPAVRAASRRLDESTLGTAAAVAEATDRLDRERARLTGLLTEIPVAVVLVSAAHRIVLYDGQAGEMLATVAPPRLSAPITDYLEWTALRDAHAQLTAHGRPVAFEVASTAGDQTFKARLKPLADSPGYLLLLDESEVTLAPGAARPLVYDFALLDRPISGRQEERSLSDLVYVVFDTETTGLVPHQDEIVQIGAVRVLNSRIVPGEDLDLLVDPGRPIPASSSKVHGIADKDVAGAPDIVEAGRHFHAYAREAVLVAHNAPFDMAFLQRRAERMGVTFDQPILDTVLLSAVLFGMNESHSLDAVCTRLRITIPEAERHTALGDARATAQALCAMLPMLQARGLTRLGEVVGETRKYGRLLTDLN